MLSFPLSTEPWHLSSSGCRSVETKDMVQEEDDGLIGRVSPLSVLETFASTDQK